MKTRSCASCGATVELPDATLSAQCAFCDSPLVDTDARAESVDAIVSFDLDQKRASAVLGKFLAGRWFAPEAVRTASGTDQLHAVFVPFYVFDATTHTRWSASVGIHWTDTETYTEYDNGKPVTKTRQVRRTDWHDTAGSHASQWLDHLVSASRGLPEADANELEPFDLGRSQPYAPARVAGVPAELPTNAHEHARATAHSELAERARHAVAQFLPGDTHSGLDCDTQSSIDAMRLVLLPVWISVVEGPEGPLRFLVNGQTGEVVGHTPTSTRKVVSLVAAIAGVIAAVVVGALLLTRWL